MPTKSKKAKTDLLPVGLTAAQKRDHAYGLGPPAAKRQKKSDDPRDLSALEAAAKKAAKQADAARLKELGADPKEQLRGDGQRTGLRNLGATCYMNSLLQTLTHIPYFRKVRCCRPRWSK